MSVTDSKIYKVTNIDFRNLAIEATRTNLPIADVPENDVFPMEDFREFRIRLINGGDCDEIGGIGEASEDVIDFSEWIRTHNV